MKVFVSIVLVSSLLATRVSAVLQLKADNYLKLTEGKTVFVKFFAPWVRIRSLVRPFLIM